MRDPEQLRAALLAGRPLFGIWASIPTSLTAEVAAVAGADYVVVDQQHGAVDASAMTAMLQAIHAGGAAPLVRVARNDPWLIGNALDFGAVGVIVPMVDDAAQAARAVAACRYAPEGERSWGPVRAVGSRPLCLTMVETRGGLEQVDEIARTPGLDGIYIGPSDLALSLGLEPTPRLVHAPVLEGIERVRSACDAAELMVGLHCLTGEDAARFTDAGFAMITVGGDLRFLRDALERALATARGER